MRRQSADCLVSIYDIAGMSRVAGLQPDTYMLLPTMPVSTDSRLRLPPPALRSELIEGAWNHGFRRETGAADGWLYFASDIDVPGEIGLAVATDGVAWFLTVEHPGVAAELAATPAAPVPKGKRGAFAFSDSGSLRRALHRSYELACSLPSAPLSEFEAELAGLGATEAATWARRRIGQDVFRRALLRYWQGRCPLTGITEPALLRASHIIPWTECTTDADRLDVHNGLLLAAHWDAAFDAGLVGFNDHGAVICSRRLGVAERAVLAPDYVPMLSLTDEHRLRLAWHRDRYGLNV